MATKQTVTWLGDNATKRLTNPETGKSVKVGEDITLSTEQIRILKRNGHTFGEVKGDDADKTKSPAKVPATP